MALLDGIYCGDPPAPAALAGSWNLDPVLLGGLALLAWWARGSRAGLAGVAVLALAYVSPLCALSTSLFSARVLHHVLVVAVAAPALALSRPAAAPHSVAVPFLAATAALWAWHTPVPYDAAYGNAGLYALMQASLLATSVVFWRAAFSRPDGGGLLWALGAYVAMALLGALIALAPSTLYAAHGVAPLAWGLSPLEDQQLGGLVMWVPAGLPFAAWIALLARRAWAASETPA